MNLNLREALAIVTRAGGTVAPKRGTGELVISHPALSRRIVVNGRRKDTPRKLASFLNRLSKV